MSDKIPYDSIPCLTPGSVLAEKKTFAGATRYRAINHQYATVSFFNQSGFKVANSINGRHSILDLTRDLVRTSGIAFEKVLEEVSKFIENLRKQKIVYLRNIEEPPAILETTSMTHPEEVWLNITSRCNLHCITCFKNEDRKTNEDIPEKKLFEIIDEIKNLGVKMVVVSGGEPFMRPDALDVIEYLNAKEINVLLVTNGTLITEEIAKRLGNSKPKIIQLSLDGSTAEINDKIRGAGTYDKIIHAAKLLIKQGLDVRLYPTVTRLNLHDLPNFKKLVMELRPGFDHLAFAKFHPTGRGLKNEKELHVPEEEFAEYMISFAKSEYELRNSGNSDHTKLIMQEDIDLTEFLPNRVAYGARKVNCGLGTGTLSIEADGNVYPCHWLHFKEFEAGNLYEKSLAEIYYGSKVFQKCKMMRVDSSFPRCQACDYRYFCGGGCRARALFQENNIVGMDPNCKAHFEHFNSGLWTDKLFGDC